MQGSTPSARPHLQQGAGQGWRWAEGSPARPIGINSINSTGTSPAGTLGIHLARTCRDKPSRDPIKICLTSTHRDKPSRFPIGTNPEETLQGQAQQGPQGQAWLTALSLQWPQSTAASR